MSEPSAVSEFLREFDRALSGSRRWRDDVVAEIHAHLLDAVDAIGDDPEDVQRILEQFGNPRCIAHELNELAAQSRRLCGVSVFGACAAAATMSIAVLTTSGVERRRDVGSASRAHAFIGEVVAATPSASKIRLRSPGAAWYSLVRTR